MTRKMNTNTKVSGSVLKYPIAMKSKLERWLEGNQNLLKEVENQKVLQIRNRLYHFMSN